VPVPLVPVPLIPVPLVPEALVPVPFVPLPESLVRLVPVPEFMVPFVPFVPFVLLPLWFSVPFELLEEFVEPALVEVPFGSYVELFDLVLFIEEDSVLLVLLVDDFFLFFFFCGSCCVPLCVVVCVLEDVVPVVLPVLSVCADAMLNAKNAPSNIRFFFIRFNFSYLIDSSNFIGLYKFTAA